ncbi:MAG TPA: T9SS type A sorting domain-containing protein [Lacibacter sp.]|nr:T9SS type A sorting domain-containing protein [Lacibacter sp.]
MKKFVLVLSLFVSFASIQKANAQCDIKDVVISILNTTQSGSNCNVTFNVSFMFNNNGGNKTVVIQAWKENDYPNYWNCTNESSTVNKAPKAADLRKTTAPYSVGSPGPLPFLNIAFDAATQTVIPSSSYPGGGVTLGSGYTVAIGATQPDGYFLVTLSNLSVSVPNQNCGDGVTIKADVWSSQASITSQWTPHCVICGQTFAFNYPTVTGSQPCSLINGVVQRRFQFTVTNNNTNQAIQYTYKVYRDINGNDLYDPGTDVVSFSENTLQSLNAGQIVNYGPTIYTGNSGATLNQKVFVVLDIVGLNQRDYLLFQPSCGSLPVKLKNFNASRRTGRVALTWETAEELNNKGFEIQRRIGNDKYETIAFIDSKAPGGNGSDYTYSYDDMGDPKDGVTYYRLRQVDLDGNANFSDIRSIRSNSKSLTVSVYPNPSRGIVNVAIPEGVGVVDVVLEDFTGKQVQRWNSMNVRNLQLNNLKPGIYMLRINARSTGEQAVERILIQ